MSLRYFSRSQLGVILLLGAALLVLYAWRAHVLFAPSPPPPGIMSLTFVEVTGPVAHPGVYSFPQPPTLLEALERAGGPVISVPANPTVATGSRIELGPKGLPRIGRMSGAQLLTLGLPLDLNRATAEDLAAVPEIGPALANRIVDYRQAHGPFEKIDELEEKVLGFGPKNLEKLKSYLVIGSQEQYLE